MPADATGAANDTDLWVICSCETIRPGGAKAFNLARATESSGSQPFPIVIVRTVDNQYFGYVNSCPHHRTWLDYRSGGFFTPDRSLLRCSRHGATFEIATGLCTEGPCQGASLARLTVVVAEGEVMLSGVTLVDNSEQPDPFEVLDDSMEVMINPD
jgi:nitrite reductase/ring-hydroxylating ferredoxin subunit